MTEEIEALYQQIADTINDTIPADWLTAWVQVEMTDNYGSVACYYQKRGFAEPPVYISLPSSVFDSFDRMRLLFRELGQEPWSMATFILQSDGKFSIDYEYEDISLEHHHDRRIAWMRKYLDI